MRIISGQYKGRIITPPRNLRARPTTDFAKENLFNVLAGFGFDYEECDVLDLFAGTGSVSYEFASRGARSVTAVEINAVHHAFIRRTAAELDFDGRSNLIVVKANVFNYLRACTRRFDIVFSDAPYDLPGSEEVISLVFERGLLRCEGETRDDGSIVAENGLLIFEHSCGHDFSTHPRFLQTRNYGSVQFSLFG
ncbi:MAG: RsmD family RNA methyltransferase [Alistipes sp.]|jgi:16S rRNA (guanine(966)-N(2))-methyltransferase RsmD|nr:RsmD family RNA methyltransferase [Alistipes sp.]